MFTIQNKREPSWILLERREYLLDTVKSPNPSGFHHIDISRDVTFDKEKNLKKPIKCQHGEIHEEDVPPKKVEVAPSPKIEESKDHDMLEPQEPPTMDISQNRKPSWVRETIE